MESQNLHANQSEKSKEPTSPFFQFLSSLKVKHLSELQLFLFAFAMLLGNRTSGWNSGLNTHGVSALWYNHLFSASGFICLCLCIGEMASALPFSGGVFGFVRAALGPFFGFMIASCEFVFAILSISLKAQRLLSSGTDSNNAADSGGVIMIFAFCLGLNLIGGKPVFFFTSMMGFFVAMMLIVYLCGTLSVVGTDKVNFTHYSPAVVDFSWFHIMSERAAVGGQFSGIQLLPLLSEYMREPREQLPRLMLGSCIFFMVMTVFLVLAAISQDPGAKKIQSAPLPLQAGYVRIFHIHDLSNMNWFDLPFQISAIFCLFFCAGKQLLSLSRSGLLPPIFTNLFPGSDSPYVCYTFTAIVGAGLNIMVLYNQDYLTEIKAVSSTVSITILISCLISFLVFRRKFSSMARSFVNPLGDISAIYGIIVFVTSFWAILFYNPANKLFLVGLGGYWTLCAVFFCTYLVHHQKFSEEEKKVMFKAYLINANQKKRKNMLRNNKVGSLTTRSKSDNDLSQSRDRRNSQTSIGISASIAGKHAPPAEIRKAEEV